MAQAPALKNEGENKPSTSHFAAVINNRESKIVGQLPATGKDAQGILKIGPRVEIVPGFNLVPTAQLDILKQNAVFAGLFTERIGKSRATEHNVEKQGQPILVEVPGAFPKDRPFSKLSIEEAVPIIKEILVVKTLNLWLKGETRDTVRLSLQQQIDLLRTGRGAEDEDES